ncbi:SAM-dependent methyltransferase [Amycolatopsis anabasis]|uniref:SAM-dependent methyltransferase n=1 Tax=Amycolatopsis anabasis TaxID=1840409 RepID=UPI00131CC168|nr:SAM-dependent methyltransferase [Amycolatopsis anabasis]
MPSDTPPAVPASGLAEATAERLRANLDKPSPARIYDYLLGGHNHYAIDREFGDRQRQLMPDIVRAMKANRAFLGRVVRYAVEAGIRQFVDIGSGLPTVGQVHEIADQAAPGQCRVVYIDNEPIAYAHAEALLGRNADPDRHHALYADLLEYVDLWTQVSQINGIDPQEPTCLLVVALLHFITPEQAPENALEFLRGCLPPGSLLAMSHGCDELDDPGIQEVVRNYSKESTTQTCLRTRAEFTAFFGDFELVDPGVVWVPQWRPDGNDKPWKGSPATSRYLAGLARKPAPPTPI